MATNGVVNSAISRAVKMLDASGAKYRIVTPDGEEIGDLYAAPINKRKLLRDDRPYGALAAHMRPYLANVKPGEVVRIPYSGFDREHLRGAVAAHLSNTWGAGTYVTTLTDMNVEVLRVA